MDEKELGEMIDTLFSDLGITSHECPFDSDDPNLTDEYRVLRSNLIRELLVGGLFESSVSQAAMAAVNADAQAIMNEAGLTMDRMVLVLHTYMHLSVNLYNDMMREAVMPWIKNQVETGKYENMNPNGPDFIFDGLE
jgi:hypothetical protein